MNSINKQKSLMAQRIRRARKDAGISQVELARLINVSKQTINRIEQDQVKRTKYIKPIARILNVNYQWITGESEDVADSWQNFVMPENFFWIPMIAWDEIPTRLTEGVVKYKREGSPEKRKAIVVNKDFCPSINHNCFALRIEDRAMIPNFRPGDVIAVNPKLKPDPGDVVLVGIKGRGDFVLRKLIIESENANKNELNINLTAFNSDFAHIEMSLNYNEFGKTLMPVVLHSRVLAKRNVFYDEAE